MFSYPGVFEVKGMALWGKTSSTILSEVSDIQAQTEAQFLATPIDWNSFLPPVNCFPNKPFSEGKAYCVLKGRHREEAKTSGHLEPEFNSQKVPSLSLSDPPGLAWDRRLPAGLRLPFWGATQKSFQESVPIMNLQSGAMERTPQNPLPGETKAVFTTETRAQLIGMTQWDANSPKSHIFTALHIC